MIDEKTAVERFNRQRERIGAYHVPSLRAEVAESLRECTYRNIDPIDVLERLVHECAILRQYALDLLKLAREQ